MTAGRVEILDDERHTLVRLRGEIDLSNALAITDEVVEAGGERRLVLDLSNVTYLDSSGVRMIFEIARRCMLDEQQIVLLVPQGSPLNRILTMTHVQEAVTMVSDLDEVSPT